jgi:lipopolysaccharide export system protein LptA
MRISVERLRIWLVVGAALLVLVIAGFLGYARYRTHRFLAGLPARLGVDIRRETNGYTYSQSVGGKTVMTLHASKAVEHKDGKLTLHDVRMVLYGRKQDRADRISGAEFEYDQASEVIRAVGEVHIDLQAPAGTDAHGKPAVPAKNVVAEVGDDAEGDNNRLVHVKTSGLVYLKKLGVAATDQEVEFRFGAMTGYAKGAEYNSDTGVVILQSEVKTNGLQHGTPVVLTATHAELDRQSQQALLTDAKYISPGQSARGDHAIVHLRPDGSAERIEANGHVTISGPAAGTVTAPRADVLLTATSQAKDAHFFGGVNYEDVGSLREGKGQAQDARIAFDGAGHPENVVLTGAVHVNERIRAMDAVTSPWSVRDATAGKMTFALASGSDMRRKVLREAEATSSAHLTLVTDLGTASSARSEMAGDLLHGRFTGEGKTAQLSTIHGAGHTSLRRVSAQGAEQTSAGDTLDVRLRAAKHTGAPSHSVVPQHAGAQPHAASQTGTEEIASATQAGHVVLTSRAAAKTHPEGAKSLPPSTERAMAELAVYDGDADHLTLTGHAQVVGDASTLFADRIILEHESGDATAAGSVKANYLQPNATEPVHVLADHAELQHDAQRAIFYGAAGKPARLWQGASQVEAPVLDLEQDQQRLTAHGDGPAGSGPAPVHAVLVGNSTAKRGEGAPKAGSKPHPSIVRVASQTMVYRDATRQVDFAGDVRVDDVDGTLRAHQATAFLQPAPTGGAGASKKESGKSMSSGVAFGGSVDRIVADGKIEMEQPGRHAAGEHLVYTASDAIFVLTGTTAKQPKLIDDVQGTVTGTSLRFHTGDDSVTVTGGGQDDLGQRVHTVTRVKQK